jgi:glycosyltransferase involved in cell wall biosynthesis
MDLPTRVLSFAALPTDARPTASCLRDQPPGRSARPTACFFARLPDPTEITRVGFYAQDIAMLRELGYSVTVATQPAQLVRADLIFAWWWTWAFIPLLHPARIGRPVVVTGTFNYWLFDERPAHERALMRFALRSASANVFHSKREFESVSSAMSVRNAHYVPPAIDCDRYVASYERREPFILTVATMPRGSGIRKCIPEVIRAAPLIRERHPEIRFVIAGVPDPAFVQLARDVGAGDYVSFPGTVSDEQKADLMRRCSVYLGPSRFEGFGVALAEALASGAPLVTSPVGEVPEVAGDAALYVDGNSPSAIARAACTLLEDRELAAALGRAGSARVRARFTIPQHRERWRRILAAL